MSLTSTRRPGRVAQAGRVALTGLAALALASSAVTSTSASPHSRAAAASRPSLSVRTVMSGLDHPWDVVFLPHGGMLVTERDRERLTLLRASGAKEVLASTPSHMWHGGETGFMGITIDPRFTHNHRFYTCHGYSDSHGTRIHVVVWRLNGARTRATQIKPLVTGIPVTSGRHGGCRLRFDRQRRLYVGTGDAATAHLARKLTSLGGKILRINPDSGHDSRGNPFGHSSSLRKQKVYNYGHRNVQGLALRSGGGLWSVEHGPDRDDEVNVVRRGADYGWDPDGPGYDESVPMTDHSLPGPQMSARWSSGFPTLATSGASWLRGSQWGSWRGRLAIAALKDESLHIMHFDADGRLVSVVNVPQLDHVYGRLRTAQQSPGRALYLTTDNGGGNDRVLRVTAR